MMRAVMTAVLSLFYILYFVRMLMLRSQGITGNLLGKGDKPRSALRIELALRAATLAGGLIQFGSVLLPIPAWPFREWFPLQVIGSILAFAGFIFFAIAIATMRNNWRAGFTKNQNTELVTKGIYKISRNPAFVGFDLLYLGCATAFPNLLNIAVALASLFLFHWQILGEENYLTETFGEKYVRYMGSTRRYL